MKAIQPTMINFYKNNRITSTLWTVLTRDSRNISPHWRNTPFRGRMMEPLFSTELINWTI